MEAAAIEIEPEVDLTEDVIRRFSAEWDRKRLREYEGRLARREKAIARCGTVQEQQAELVACSRGADGFVGWANNWAWIFDPKANGGQYEWPVELFAYQEEAARRIIDASSMRSRVVVIEKSREMGWSWLVCLLDLWWWLFTPRWSGMLGSAKQELVDDGTESPEFTLFGKFVFGLFRCPPWMRPSGWRTPQEAKRRRLWRELNLTNNDNGARLYGAAMGENFGVSRRMAMVGVDEAGTLPGGGWKIRKSLTSVANLQIWWSNPRGNTNAFHHYAKKTKGVIKISTHWSEHPWKDPKREPLWYPIEVETMPPEDIRSELEIDYEASVKGVIFSRLRRSRHLCEDTERWEKIEADFLRNGPQYVHLAGMDFGEGLSATTLVSCFWHEERRSLYVCDYLEAIAKPVWQWAQWIIDMKRRYIAEWGKWGRIYGDPSAWKRNESLTSWAWHLRRAGITELQKASKQSDKNAIRALEQALDGKGGSVLIGPRAEKLFSRLSLYRWDIPETVVVQVERGEIVGSTFAAADVKPRKDENSHGPDGLLNVTQRCFALRAGPARGQKR